MHDDEDSPSPASSTGVLDGRRIVADPGVLSRYAGLARDERLLPVQVTPHYARLVHEEIEALGDRSGPLYKTVYPTDERITVRAPDEVSDFVDDRGNMPLGVSAGIVRKYDKRILFLITDRCAGHCMYCFRQDLLSEPGHPVPLATEQKVDALVAYAGAHPEIEEVILSGGDPLSAPRSVLDLVLRRLREETAVPHLRIHSRNLVFAPDMLTGDLCEIMARWRVRFVLHVIHPYELVDELRAAVARLRSHGVRCYAQFPLLRGINDHVRVLARLLTDLDEQDVRPIGIFVPDPISYSATFRIPLSRVFSTVDELNESTAAWVNSVRVILDTPAGKVRRENIVDWDHSSGVVTFERAGRRIRYRDLPESIDVPGDVRKLLWKG